ncbi:MAG TPA: hypothetical protein VK421_20095 [Pyrinomonadaceae bacterium]|nr:hypothetical protein [Pyrinomonadaceae bacterium]
MRDTRPDVDRLLEYSDWLAIESRRLVEEGAAMSERLAGVLEQSLEAQRRAEEAQLNSSPTITPGDGAPEPGGE